MPKAFLPFPLTCMVTRWTYAVQNDVILLHGIEAVIKKQMEEFEFNKDEALNNNITKVRVLNHYQTSAISLWHLILFNIAVVKWYMFVRTRRAL